jgi:hypothetical protein
LFCNFKSWETLLLGWLRFDIDDKERIAIVQKATLTFAQRMEIITQNLSCFFFDCPPSFRLDPGPVILFWKKGKTAESLLLVGYI